MRIDTASPFDTIESAHEYVTLLSRTLTEAKREIEADVERERAGATNRRLQALLVAVYNLERLEIHLTRSARLLNDLRSLRRLLFEERAAKPAAPATKPHPHTAAVPKNGHPAEVA